MGKLRAGSAGWLEDLELRARARLGNSTSEGSASERLVYELRVHQIELEMQNDELLQSQLELDNACDRFRNILAAAPMGFLVVDEKGCVRDANALAAKSLGQEKTALIGRHLQGFLPTSDADRLHLSLRDSFGTNEAHRLDVDAEVEGRPSSRLRLHLAPVVEHESIDDRRCWVFLTDLAGEADAEGPIEAVHAGVCPARPDAADTSPGAVSVVADMVGTMGGLLSEKIAVEAGAGLESARVASRHELERVVFQLCLRAFEDTPAATAASLRITREQLDGESTLAGEQRSGLYLRLSMCCETDATLDEGQRRPSLVALAAIVERCSGFLDLPEHHAPGCSRPIEVYLPLLPESADDPSAESTARPTLLLVDDDPILLQAISRMVSLGSYEVIAAGSGAQALAIATSDQKIDVLLTDVRMPGMNGGELGRLMAKLRPNVPRLYMSGDRGGVVLEDGATCLAKPFRHEQLQELLDERLGRSGSK